MPVLIGINILSPLLSRTRDTYGVRYLQPAQLCTPWYLAFRCLTLREKELDKRSHILTLVKSAEAGPITIAPNSNVAIHGYLYNEVPYHPVCALLQHTQYSHIPTDLDIEPSLITYDLDQISTVPVNISNITTRTVTVYPRDTLCEIQPVTVQDFHISSASAAHTNILDEVRIPKDELTLDQLSNMDTLLHKYQDIFSTCDTDIGYNASVEHYIELMDDTPFKQRYRRIPPSMLDEVRDHIQQQLAAGVIRKSYSPFSSNVVLVRKKNGQLRICIDYRQLNNRTKKDNYALPRIDEILDS